MEAKNIVELLTRHFPRKVKKLSTSPDLHGPKHRQGWLSYENAEVDDCSVQPCAGEHEGSALSLAGVYALEKTQSTQGSKSTEGNRLVLFRHCKHAVPGSTPFVMFTVLVPALMVQSQQFLEQRAEPGNKRIAPKLRNLMERSANDVASSGWPQNCRSK